MYVLQGSTPRKAFILRKMAQIFALTFVIDYPQKVSIDIYIYIRIYTNVKMNEYGCRDAPCEKSCKQGNPFSNTIKDTSTIMRNPPYIVQTKGYA